MPLIRENTRILSQIQLPCAWRQPTEDEMETIYFLYSREKILKIRSDFLSMQDEVDHDMRKTLSNWLHDVVTELNFSLVTWYLAINFIDRYCSSRRVTRGEYQLVGITCLFIAMKFEEKDPISHKTFVVLTDNAYCHEQILSMESQILNELGFNLSGPTPVDFISFLLQLTGIETRALHLSNYLAELSTLEYRMTCFPPSVISAASFILALNRFGMDCVKNLPRKLVSKPKHQSFPNVLFSLVKYGIHHQEKLHLYTLNIHDKSMGRLLASLKIEMTPKITLFHLYNKDVRNLRVPYVLKTSLASILYEST